MTRIDTTTVDETVGVLTTEVRQLRLANADLERRLDECQLRYIEASNPGIDMDDVRRIRAHTRKRIEEVGGIQILPGHNPFRVDL